MSDVTDFVTNLDKECSSNTDIAMKSEKMFYFCQCEDQKLKLIVTVLVQMMRTKDFFIICIVVY